jgi:hypothetical protein
MAQVLASFKISKAVENGYEVDPVVNFLPGVISHPAPFKMSIKPRSQDHEELIRSIEKVYPWRKSDARDLAAVTY